MIEISNVNKKYHSKANQEVVAIDGINLKFNHNGLVFILGKSGSGKSTLLNILGGLDSANTSKIFINKKKLNRFDETTCSEYRNTYIGFVFQEYNLLDDLNVYDNIALALQMQNREVDKETVLNILKEVDLEGLEERELDELSGGQKQRVAIARALVKNPEIILADEPTGNLDSETSEQVFELFKRISKDKLIICVSHDAEYAHKYADRIIELSDGHIIKDTNPKINDELVVIPEKIRAKLPFSLIWKMSFGNILNNKLRLLVTCVIVAFLTAVLSTVYTSLYVSNNVTKDLMNLSKQDHLLLVEPVPFQSNKILTPSFEYNSKRKLNTDVMVQVREMSQNNHAILYSKTQLMLNEDWLRVKDIDVNWGDVSLLESDLIPKPNIELMSDIQSSYLSFVSMSNEELLDNLIGRAPNNRYEVVVSNYLAELLLKYKYTNLSSIQELINEDIWIRFTDKMKLKLVGVQVSETPLLREDTTILNTSFTNLYVHSSFSRYNLYPTSQVSFGVKLSENTDIKKLIQEYKSIGTFTILPRYTDALNRYTRFELTLIMGLLVPLIGYFMVVFLGNYISSSILFRKKQIGILRAIGCEVNEMNKIFLIEALIIGLFIMGLVLVMVPFMLDILNFAFMVHFFDTYISFFHYPIFHLGVGHFIEVFSLIVLVFTVLIIVLSYHINLLDPVAVISGH